MLHLAALPVSIGERLARPSIPDLHHPMLITGSQIVPADAPSHAVHLRFVHRQPADLLRLSRIIQLNISVSQPDSEQALSPIQPTDRTPVLRAPLLHDLLGVRVQELHGAHRRARSQERRVLARPLDAREAAVVSLRERPEVRDDTRVEVLVVHVAPARDRDRVACGPREREDERVRGDAGPVEREDELLPRAQVRRGGGRGDLGRGGEQLQEIEAVHGEVFAL